MAKLGIALANLGMAQDEFGLSTQSSDGAGKVQIGAGEVRYLMHGEYSKPMVEYSWHGLSNAGGK